MEFDVLSENGFQNIFESWRKDVVSHFRFYIGKDHSIWAHNEDSANFCVELEPLLSILAGPETSNYSCKDRAWFRS